MTFHFQKDVWHRWGSLDKRLGDLELDLDLGLHLHLPQHRTALHCTAGQGRRVLNCIVFLNAYDDFSELLHLPPYVIVPASFELKV